MPEASALPEVLNLAEPGGPTPATDEEKATLALQYQGDVAVLRAIDGSHVPQHLPVLDSDGNVIANYSVTGVTGEEAITTHGTTRQATVTTVKEHIDMLMVAHHLRSDPGMSPEEPLLADRRPGSAGAGHVDL